MNATKTLKLMLLVTLLIALTADAKAWYNDTHTLICKMAGVEGDCNIADNEAFQKENPDLTGFNHMCLDSTDECNARQTAEEYASEGKKHIAAHLLADSMCPAHWHSYYYKCHKEFEDKVNQFVANSTAEWDVTVYCTYKGQQTELKASNKYLQEVADYVRKEISKQDGKQGDRWRIPAITAITATAAVLIVLVILWKKFLYK